MQGGEIKPLLFSHEVFKLYFPVPTHIVW